MADLLSPTDRMAVFIIIGGRYAHHLSLDWYYRGYLAYFMVTECLLQESFKIS